MRNTEEKSIITFELKNNKADVKWELKKESSIFLNPDKMATASLVFAKYQALC